MMQWAPMDGVLPLRSVIIVVLSLSLPFVPPTHAPGTPPNYIVGKYNIVEKNKTS